MAARQLRPPLLTTKGVAKMSEHLIREFVVERARKIEEKYIMEFETGNVATNEKGGSQSELLVRADLLPPTALLVIAKILKAGSDKYGEDNWRLIPPREHVNHVITHLFNWLRGDRTEAHLAHAATRLLFALDLYELDKQ
jgi:hypothetical protein